MNYLRAAAKRVASQLGYHVLPKLVSITYMGAVCQVRNGTLDAGDYDDAWMFALAHHARIVFDVGANIGQSAFNMLHAPNVECVVLVDAAPLALTIAADTLIRNRMGHRVKFINAFVSDGKDEDVDFLTSGHDAGGRRVSAGAHETLRQTIRVATTTVDEMTRQLALVPELVKVDAEGQERQVLVGSSDLAHRACTRFLIEMHSSPLKSQRQTTEEVLQWCAGTQYSAWYLKEAVRLDSVDLVAHRGRYHLLLQPESWPYPEWLREIPQGAPTVLVLELMRAGRS